MMYVLASVPGPGPSATPECPALCCCRPRTAPPVLLLQLEGLCTAVAELQERIVDIQEAPSGARARDDW